MRSWLKVQRSEREVYEWVEEAKICKVGTEKGSGRREEENEGFCLVESCGGVSWKDAS